MTPVLHRHTPASHSGINRIPSSFSDISRAFPVSVLLFPPRPQLLKPALEALSEALLVGGTPRASVPSQQVGFRGGEIRKLRSDMGGRRLEDRALVVRVDGCKTNLGEARLTGRGLILYAHHGKHAG